VGDVVRHKKLGKGDVIDVYPLGEDVCAVVSFEKSGQKKIVLRYANLEMVSRAKVEPESKEDRKERREKEDVEESGEVEVEIDEEDEESEEEHKDSES
jgi:hypothetical protein